MKKINLLSFLLMFLFANNVKSQMYVMGDISAIPNYSAFHDSTQCATLASESWFLTINNSFVGDSIIIKDQFSGNILAYDVNTIGQNPWNTTLNPNSIIPYMPDDQLVGGMANFGGQQLKIISGPDTIFNINSFYQFFVPNPCTYDNVSGTVYIDNNSDCNFNTGDIALNAITVASNATLSSPMGNYYSNGYTNALGQYSAKVQQSWMTSYNVSIPSFYQFIFPSTACSPSSYTYTTLPQTSANFSLQCTSNIDVQCYATAPINARPNIPFMLHPLVSNTGCDTAWGFLTLIKDTHTIYNAALSTVPAIYVNGDTLQWSYSGLSNLTNGAYWNSLLTGVHLTPDNTVNIGDTLCFTVKATFLPNDINFSNNEYSLCIPVVNSYDPNVKEVTPKGTGVSGNIPPTTPQLNYTIHFQNTGTAPAFNVYIIDTLSTNVDSSSLKIIGASHVMTPEWLTPNVVRFNFYNILLPDSMSNEPNSHGQVSFSIKPKIGLNIGTQIKNKAEIYFDSNPAIVTNIALNTIALPNEISIIDNNTTLNIYPNPANQLLQIEIKGDVNSNLYELEIYTLNAQLVKQQTILNRNAQVQINDLIAGMYFIKIKNGDHTYMTKFIKE